MSEPEPATAEPERRVRPGGAGAAPNLDAAESSDAARRTTVGARVVHEAIRREGEEELARTSSALAWSALAAGLSMGFSLIVEGLLRAHLPEARWTSLVTKTGYSVGFLIVVLGRQQLFTENTLTPMLPLFARRDAATLQNVVRLWGVVLAANLLGAAAIAWAVRHAGVFDERAAESFLLIGREALAGSFGATLVGAVFAGWLIALMVWLLPVAETARVWVVFLLSYIVGLGGFAHIIAGSVETLYAVAAGAAGWTDYLRWMLATLIGNVVGGVALVSALNHAQVAADVERKG